MTDWQIIDGDDFPESPPEDPPRPPSRWHWVILIVAIFSFLLIVGFMTLGEQRTEPRATISENQIADEKENQFPVDRRQQVVEISNGRPFPLRQSLTGTFSGIISQSTKGNRFWLSLPGLFGVVDIEVPAKVEFNVAQGISLPVNCIALGAKVQVEAEFLDRERRFRALNVTIQDISPLARWPAHENTMAYVLSDVSPDFQYLEAIYGNKLTRPSSIIGSSGQGSFQEIFPLPIFAGEQPHFLLRLNLPDCEHTLFVRYKPGQDSSDFWIAPSPTAQWIWRPDQENLLFFYQDAGDRSFLGWNIKTQRLVPAAMWVDGRYVGLLDLTERGILPNVRYYYRPLRSLKLSADGEWLAYLAGAPDKLGVIDTGEQSDLTLIQVEPGEGLEAPVWSLNLDQSRLAVLAGPVIEDGKIDPVRLLVVSPNQPDNFTVIAEASDGERFAWPVFCSDGALLYRVEQDGQYRLQHHVPGGLAQTLLTQDRPFQPLACP